jgi:hypothetical protein
MKNKSIVILSIVLILGVALTALWKIGLLGMWSKGISYIAGSVDSYSYSHTLLDDEYSVEIDLSDLDSNKGKVLYNDGIHQIVVDSVDNTGTINSGGYRIHFRSKGTYSLSGATLISGFIQSISSYIYEDMTARLTSEYKGMRYEGSVMGMTGLNYRDGDMFSFYLFPYESYYDGTITLNEDGKVKVTVTNLCKNIWSRK